MGFWKKESKTHFRRDEKTGKVLDVYRSGDEPRKSKSKTPVSNALMKKYYEEHPEKTRKAKAGRIGKKILDTSTGIGKRIDKYAVNYAKSQQRSSGKPLPPLGSYSVRNNFNPFGDTFDRGQPRQKKKSQPSTKYAIVGGKAYPIAGTGKKKKKTQSKRRKHDPNDPFSFPDLW